MSTKHTPGPWTIERRPDWGSFTVDVGMERVAIVPTEANAHLIAAAPELLSALGNALAVLSSLDGLNIGAIGVLEDARATIAKATGQGEG
jgi:hypothetical protein